MIHQSFLIKILICLLENFVFHPRQISVYDELTTLFSLPHNLFCVDSVMKNYLHVLINWLRLKGSKFLNLRVL